METDIQRLEADEAARLKEIRLRALLEAPDAFGSTYADKAAEPFEVWEAQAREIPTWIAVVDGDDAGMVRTVPHSDYEDAAILISMWVAPEARGRGVGDRLVESVLEWARAGGFERVLLDVGDHNETAIRLYERHGFEPTGRTETMEPPRDHISEHERQCVLVSRSD